MCKKTTRKSTSAGYVRALISARVFLCYFRGKLVLLGVTGKRAFFLHAQSLLSVIALFLNPGIIEEIFYEKGDLIMTEEPQTICEWLDIDLTRLSSDDKVTLIGEIGDTLSAQDLIRVRTLADNLRLEKLEGARNNLAAKIQAECEELGMTPEEVLGIGRGRRGRRENTTSVSIKYRGPQGETWTGRGVAPLWLRKLEEEGHDREEYRVPEYIDNREGA
jgi:DNA-binding protein H-NS